MVHDQYSRKKCELVSDDQHAHGGYLAPETMAEASVTATDAAIEAIGCLRIEHGPLAFFQSGGCCDGSLPICLKDGELPPGPGDTLLGVIAGAPFYVDTDQYQRWG